MPLFRKTSRSCLLATPSLLPVGADEQLRARLPLALSSRRSYRREFSDWDWLLAVTATSLTLVLVGVTGVFVTQQAALLAETLVGLETADAAVKRELLEAIARRALSDQSVT